MANNSELKEIAWNAIKPRHVLEIRKFKSFNHCCVHAFLKRHIMNCGLSIVYCLVAIRVLVGLLTIRNNLFVKDLECSNAAPGGKAVTLIFAQYLECTVPRASD